MRWTIRRRLVSWALDILFVAWVLYIVAAGRLLPEQLVLRHGGPPHAPGVLETTDISIDDLGPVIPAFTTGLDNES